VAAGAGGARASAAAAEPRSARAEIQDLAERINRHRVAIGCRAMKWDDRLAAEARRHTTDMARRGFFNHTNPDGRDPFDRLRVAGVRFRAAAENIAMGQPTGRDVYEGWIESPGHRRNIENCTYARFGIGLYQRRWTLLLARYGE
jgi:uncharacterized protein YkwD